MSGTSNFFDPFYFETAFKILKIVELPWVGAKLAHTERHQIPIKTLCIIPRIKSTVASSISSSMHVKRKLYNKLKKTEQNEKQIEINCCCERPKSLRKYSEATDFSEEATDFSEGAADFSEGAADFSGGAADFSEGVADFSDELVDCSERLKR